MPGPTPNPDLDPDHMLQAAALLAANGTQIAGAIASVNGALARSGAEGPFFNEMRTRLRRIIDTIEMGGNGFHAVAGRLRTDAEREKAAQRWQLMHQPELKPRP